MQAVNICLKLSTSVIVVFRGRRAIRPAAAVSVTSGQQTQLLHGLFIVGHVGALGQEARGHAADVERAGGTTQLRQPRADRRPGLKGRQDGRGFNQTGGRCREERDTMRSARQS